MKVLFVYSQVEKNLETSGEAKKMMMQKDAMEANGVESDIIYHVCNGRFFKLYIRAIGLPIYSNKFIRELLDRIQKGKYDTLYIRKHIFDYSFVRMIKRVRKEYPSLNVIVEIPTYPYDREWESFVDWPFLIKEKYQKVKIKKYIDYFITFSNDDEIFGVPCIKMKNGVDPDVLTRRVIHDSKDNRIELLGVAGVETWHGFDRIIRGMHEYYANGGTYDIIFHIVGNGGEIGNLKKLVSKCELEDRVIFHGPKHGDELNRMFDISDIGVGSLGMYRIGMQEGYTLKLKEYSARGIPFIYAYDDPLIELCDSSFYRKYTNNDDAISMESIVAFHNDNLNCGYDKLADEMRAFAYDKLTWKEQMRTIIEFLRKEDK
jgi:glycosyltransferase involved in cell wall biosynthesis